HHDDRAPRRSHEATPPPHDRGPHDDRSERPGRQDTRPRPSESHSESHRESHRQPHRDPHRGQPAPTAHAPRPTTGTGTARYALLIDLPALEAEARDQGGELATTRLRAG